MQQGCCTIYLGSSRVQASAMHSFLCRKLEQEERIISSKPGEQANFHYQISNVIWEFDGIQHRIITEGTFYSHITEPADSKSFSIEVQRIGEPHEE